MIDRVVEDVPRVGPNAITRLALFILHWTVLRATPGFSMPADLDDPFDPLIWVFERDGGFHMENGEVNLEYLTLFPRVWRTDLAPLKAFGQQDLDEIDRAGSMAAFGYVLGPDGEPT
ncbi:hypothetical protein [Actinoplanes sp. NBRC 103695]|uniref:hypothetical protein n=1 Tax=Actinoplanes sp. NBRC 103695 TaxID=3032202 RepID=UPI0024A5A8CE|nr:hypothetical protein [Actinoplanes sp. NBRC 103695]GLZ00263.1 hypothetical protein Acsp02_75150 [Actinoplanes sp. NBRC 103695]